MPVRPRFELSDRLAKALEVAEVDPHEMARRLGRRLTYKPLREDD